MFAWLKSRSERRWDSEMHAARAAYAKDDLEQAKIGFRSALTAARDDRERAVTLSDLGVLLTAMSDFGEATSNLEQAAVLAQELADVKLQATVLDNQALMYRVQGRFEQAATTYESATELWERLDDKRGLAVNLNNLAMALLRTNANKALDVQRRAVGLMEETDGADSPAIAAALMSLGALEAHAGKLDCAEATIVRGLGILRASSAKPYQVGRSLSLLGDVYQAQRRSEQAHGAYREALALLEESLGPSHPWTVEAEAKSQGATAE